jgi:hypothetical protein
MAEASSWRNLLGTIISDPQERQRLANAIGVNPFTLTCWVTNQSLPRRESLYRLVKVCPPQYGALLSNLIAQEWEDFSLTDAAGDLQAAEAVPIEVYTDVLAIKATTPQNTHFWMISQRLVSAMLKQLDPHNVGVGISILACTKPAAGKSVRSLHVVGGDGTAPLKQKTSEAVSYLVGIESLAGYAVTVGRLLSLQHMEGDLLPFLKIAGIESTIACPVKREGRTAASLSVVSIQADYFLQTQLTLIESYANLLALAFTEEQFYEPERIRLSALPDQQRQRLSFSTFQQRVKQLMNAAVRNQHPLKVTAAEEQVWQQLEGELLDVPLSTEEERVTKVYP